MLVPKTLLQRDRSRQAARIRVLTRQQSSPIANHTRWWCWWSTSNNRRLLPLSYEGGRRGAFPGL